jgi:outer membrane receptor protein involved in Fe transport
MQTAHAQDESLEEVLVTGSRIVRRDLSASSPIMTVDAERFDASSTLSVESVLNQMPQFTPAQTQFNAMGEIQTSPTISPGIGSVNLRGVSTNRTLVLVDGRRAQPVNASLIVDLNSIPSAAIERVETITGGAASVYGSDALAGVVNFVLKDNFEGAALDFQSGFMEAGDGEETRFSALLGMNSDSGNANMLLGVEWYEREVAFQKNRDFYVDGWYDPDNAINNRFPAAPNFEADPANLPSQAAVDALFPSLPPGTISPQRQFFFNADGTPFVRQAYNGADVGFNTDLNRPFNGDGHFGWIEKDGVVQQQYMDGPLSTPLKRRSAFGKAHVDLNDNLRAFVQANFSRTENQTYSFGPPPGYFAWTGAIPNDGRAIPDALQTLIDSRPDPDATWELNRGLDFLGQFGPTNNTDTYQIMAGLEGDFANSDWTWEAYYSSGETNVLNFYRGMPSVQKWQNLVAAPEWGAGLAGENFDATPSGGYGIYCDTGLPIFEGTTATTSQNCIDGLIGHYKSFTTIKQDIFEANLQGGLIEMPSGELRFAAGVSTRENDYEYDPNNPQSSVFDTPLGVFASVSAEGKTSVSEIYGELLVPVLDSLDLELGYRYSDYDSNAGSIGTYKALFDWAATDGVRVRGGYQKANRAPNSAELFQGELSLFAGGFVGDPCQIHTTANYGNVPGNPNRTQAQQLCAELINNAALFGAPGSASADNFNVAEFTTGIGTIQSGNVNLESEEADTYTLGVVFQGIGGLDGLTASVDFYNIEVSGAIGTFNANTIYAQCFNANGSSNPSYTVAGSPFCALIERSDATGNAGAINLTFLNTGLIETSGVDLAVNWAKDLSSGATFYINSMMNVLNDFNTQELAGDPLVEWKDTLGQGGQFKYRLNTTFGYNFGRNANMGVRWRHLPEIRSANAALDPTTPVLPTESYNIFDLFAGYTFNDRYQLRGGIDNLLDEDPAVVGATLTDSNSNSTQAAYYDALGRRAYIGLKIQF